MAMNDDELLDYAYYHSRTELALFSRDHVRRILILAGKLVPDSLPALIPVHADVMDVLVQEARDRRNPQLRLRFD